MTDSGTLATTAQVLLAIGAGASAAQILEANTNTWILMAESDMEAVAGQNIGLVANYSTIPAVHKQWLAAVASARAAWYGINENQNSWQLATTQSKLNIVDNIWQDGKKLLKDKDIIDDLGL